MTQPSQPALLVIPSATLTSVTGDGTTYTIAFDTEIYNQSFSHTSTTITAPITGRYLFEWNICVTNVSSSSFNNAQIVLNTSNRTYFTTECDIWYLAKASGRYFDCHSSVLCDMDASDTAYLTLYVGSSTKTINIHQTSSSTRTFLNARLIC